MTLCPQHQREHDAWLDYRVAPGLRISNSAGRDTTEGVREQQRLRLQQWRDTIRSQQQLIRQACHQHTSAPQEN